MNFKTVATLICVATLGVNTVVRAAKVGEPAPAFTAVDSLGAPRKLADFKGKYVVLEWTNGHCPYVKKHYASGNMQKLQKEWTSQGVVWLTVISSAPGSEGFVDAKAANADTKKQGAAPTAVLLDPKGDLGHQFGAKTTPHMFVIHPDGRLIYNGALDDKADTDKADIASAHNYVAEALTDSMAGKPLAHPTTSPYGCSVKYAM